MKVNRSVEWTGFLFFATCKAVKRPLSSSPVSCDMASKPLLLACCDGSKELVDGINFFLHVVNHRLFHGSRGAAFLRKSKSSSPMAFFHSSYDFCICGLKFSTYMALIKALRMYSLMSSENLLRCGLYIAQGIQNTIRERLPIPAQLHYGRSPLPGRLLPAPVDGSRIKKWGKAC